MRLDPQWYTAKISHDVYDMLDQRAAMALAAGQSAIVDAVFADARERRAIAAVAGPDGVPFMGLWLRAAGGTRKARVGARGKDASDADIQVAEAQERYEIGALGEWCPVDTGQGLAEALRAISEILRQPPRPGQPGP